MDDGGNIGVLTGYTVPLETLTLQENYGHVVVLVTSGNRSFEQHPARKELLALLRRMEDRMATRALRTSWRSRRSDRDE